MSHHDCSECPGIHADLADARARVAQLEAALRGLSGGECHTRRSAGFGCGSFTQGRLCALRTARAALAASPDAAGRRTQDQRRLTDQLRDVERMAVSAGMYDAADWLRRFARLDAEGK